MHPWMATRRLNLGIFILDDDRLELAMRQSIKENNNVRRSLDLSPFGMSEDDQVHRLLRGFVHTWIFWHCCPTSSIHVNPLFNKTDEPYNSLVSRPTLKDERSFKAYVLNCIKSRPRLCRILQMMPLISWFLRGRALIIFCQSLA